MATKITPCCSVIGLNDENVFSVDIHRSKTVHHLKKAVKKEMEPKLNHLAANELEIWKVNYLAQRSRRC